MISRKTLSAINFWMILASLCLLGLPIVFGYRGNLQFVFIGIIPYFAGTIFNTFYIRKNKIRYRLNSKHLLIFGLLGLTWIIAILRGAFYKIDQLTFFTLGMGLTWIILMTFYFQALVISPADMSERANRSAVYAAGVFVFVNLVLHLLGIRSPDELFLAKYPAQMLSLLGIQTYRVVFPMASGFNSFGNLAGAALASLPFILRDRTTRTLEKIMVCVLLVSSLVSILLTDSRGPLFFSAVTLGLMILPKQLFRVLRWVLIGATILLPFLLINPPPFLVEKMSFLSRPASEWQEQAIETTEDCSPLASESSGFLTNRTAIWKATVADLNFTNPYSYIGYGFRGQLISGVSKKYSCLFTSYENQIFISSHQMWLQTIMDIGIIGLAITLIAFVFLILELDRDQTYPVKGANSAYSAYLLYIVAIGTLESSLYPDAFELFIIVFLLLTGTVVKKKESRKYD